MASYVKSKIQQSISFLPVTVIAFLVCGGFVFLNADIYKARSGNKNLNKANLSRADLKDVDLKEAHLSFADLSGAYFNWSAFNQCEFNQCGSK